MSNKFEEPNSDFNFVDEENKINEFWKTNKIYQKSLDQNKDGRNFTFFEGPPTANGLPHPGHCLTRTVKDIIPRYKTMKGYYCERKAGWDTHGLPVEIEVCKELGINGKESIEKFGIDNFNKECINSVFKYKDVWEKLTEKLGFWVNLEDAYETFSQTYIESVWWSLKQLFDKGLLYQGKKIVWWWPQGGTALSSGEVSEGYKIVNDPSLTFKYKLDYESASEYNLNYVGISFLVWTTTPWSLPSNCAIAVNGDAEYSVVREKSTDHYYILASDLVDKNIIDSFEFVKTMLGKDLVGVKYLCPFGFHPPTDMDTDGISYKHWEVVADPSVDINKGTGVLHLAPAFGEDDYEICKKNGIGYKCHVLPDGTFDTSIVGFYTSDDKPLHGIFCKDADKHIIRNLKHRGLVYKADQITHSYPFCPRAMDDPLIQYTRTSWFINTSKFKEAMLENNSHINWIPEHIKEGRFGDFLENNIDWALSRERYWGTPLPIWICNKTGYMECISNYDELFSKPDVIGFHKFANALIADPSLNESLKLHKPYIDEITYSSPKNPNGRMIRVPDVIDVWFDAGCMPFAQWGYPHVKDSKEKFLDNYPADFISEGIDQTRGWFYALMAVNTMVHDEIDTLPFENCICLGHLLGEKGEKLSKRLKNYSSPNELLDEFGADALRWSFISKNSPTTSLRFSKRLVEESRKDFLMHWYNVYSFFTIYANLDGFFPTDKDRKQKSRPEQDRKVLDRWILNELKRVTCEITKHMDSYDIHSASNELTEFVSSLSNWYVRRSRSIFWESGWSQEKADSYWTLYTCLTELAKLAAPFTPFFSEYTWKNLTGHLDYVAESVHLSPYPYTNISCINYKLLEDMKFIREVVALGMRARIDHKIKVRQPLHMCEVIVTNPSHIENLILNKQLILDELNVKDFYVSESDKYISHYEVTPNFKVLGPRFGKDLKAIANLLMEIDWTNKIGILEEKGVEVSFKNKMELITYDDVTIKLIPKEGFSYTQGPNVIVILDTTISTELEEEGLIRDLIRELQNLRKTMKFNYSDRIRLELNTPDKKFMELIEKHMPKISYELLVDAWFLSNNFETRTTCLQKFNCHVDLIKL